MGAVYKAQDMRLLRHVAIKLLRPELMIDKKKRLRFIKEAQTASSLNHPNICTIHDINEDSSQHFIVMELVEGKNLREILDEKQKLPESELVEISIKICEALFAVHQRGISHRDIKPENIMITNSGMVKVMDFGIAKLATEYVESVVELKGTTGWGQDYIDSVVDTNLSGFLGTVHYMSPEQAQGGTVDPRSDIFSFGVMLYELACGQKPFTGGTNLTILTKIIKEHTNVDLNTIDLSPDFKNILSRALQKEAENRYQTVQELLEDLKQLSKNNPTSEARSKKPGRVIILYGSVAALVIAILAIYLQSNQERKDNNASMRTSRFTSFSGDEAFPAFSPDGEFIAFSWNGPDQNNRDIYVKSKDGKDTLRLTRNTLADSKPVWSNDGQHIAFVRPFPDKPRAYDIFIIPSKGGQEERIITCHPVGTIPSITWSKDNKFLYFSKWSQQSTGVAVFRVSLKTKNLEQITFPPGGVTGDLTPSISPDGKYLGFIRRKERGKHDIFIQDLDSKETMQVTQDNTEIQGYTWGDKNILYAANLDGTSGLWKTDLSGTQKVKVLSGPNIGSPSYSSAANSIIYEESASKSDIWRLDLNQPENEVLLISSSSSININPDISPDGERIVFSSNRTGTYNFWMSNIDGSGQTQLTFFDNNVRSGTAQWSPSNDEVLIHFGKTRSYVMNLSTGQIVKNDDLEIYPIWAKNSEDFFTSVYPEIKLYFVSGDGKMRRQLTKDAGLNPKQEGDYLYYFKHYDIREIWRVSLDGTGEEPVLQEIDGLGIDEWDVVSNGLYYYHGSNDSKELSFYDFETGENRKIKAMPGASSIAIDPDEQYLLYCENGNQLERPYIGREC